MKNNKNRKYYLNKKVKQFAKIDSHHNTIFINEEQIGELPVKRQQYILELRDSYNYSVQYVFI